MYTAMHNETPSTSSRLTSCSSADMQLTALTTLLGCAGGTQGVMGCISRLTCGQTPDESCWHWPKASSGATGHRVFAMLCS